MKRRGIRIVDVKQVVQNYYFSATSSQFSTRVEGIARGNKVLIVWISGQIPIKDYVIIESAAWKREENVIT
jgi:hypothetical protein